jgi:hypothetical protein
MKIKSPAIILNALLTLILVISQAVHADDIIIPIASQGAYLGDVERPSLGEKRQDIINRFGEPTTKHPTTGTPPITRWDYEDFSVYFEGDVVLHSVLKHRRIDSVQDNNK